MAEKNSLWRNIRKKAEQNRRTGTKPKKPTAEMLRQERKIKAKQKADGGYLYAEGGQYLTVDGEYHRVYRNADGDIVVNHPKEDKGEWDTINLTDKSGANTIAEGVASVRKWHRENPSYATGGYVDGDDDKLKPKYVAERSTTATKNTPSISTSGKESKPSKIEDSIQEDVFEIFDPTGISSWNDALAEDANILDYISVVPGFGIVGKGLKLMKSPRTGLSAYHALKASQAEDLIQRLDNKAQGGYMYPDGGTIKHGVYANSQGVIMGPIKQPDGSYKVPVSNEGLPQVNLPEIELEIGENPYGPITLEEYLNSNFNPLQTLLPSVKPYIQQYRSDGTMIPASGRADIDNTLSLAFMGVKPSYANFEKGVNKVGNVLTTQTPLKETWRLNPWSFQRKVNELNPSKQFAYRTLGRQEGFENTLKSGSITPKPGGSYHTQHDAAFYNVGHPLYRYGEDFDVVNGAIIAKSGPKYIAEVPLSNPKVIPRYIDKPDNYRITIGKEGSGHVGINEPGVTIYKEDWLRGYKPVNIFNQKAAGGTINPYMYYAGGPMYYDVGGKVIKNIGAGAYGILSGAIGAVTGGATNKFMDKGYNYLQKKASKNFDPNDPDDVKWAKSQDQFSGYGTAVGGIGAGILTGNVQGAIGQTATGLNKAFQASDWASDDFKKWSNISSTAIGIGAGLAGGSLNVESASKAGQAAANFGSQVSKYAPYANQGLGMIGGNQQSLLEQAEARQDYLNSPEYLAMKEKQNQAYVNQGLSFASTGGNINNSLNLQNSMRGKYNSYKRRYSKGGTFQKFGINEIPDSAGYHHENAYGGVPIGPNAMAEGGEFVLDNNYVVSDEVDGMNTQTDEFGRTMAQNLKRDLSKYTMRDLNSKNKDSLRRPMDPLAEQTINQIKQKAMMETEMARAEAQAKEQERQAMVNGALQYAAAGGKLNKDLEEILSNDIQSYVEADNYYAYGGYLPKDKRFNMPNSYAKGGSIHIKKSKRGTFTAAAKKRGKSVQEFARQVLANKGNYSSAMVKKANFARNAAKWHHAEGGDIRPDNPGFNALPEYVQAKIMNNMAHGGPVVSNVPQDFDLYAQNRGGMMMARGGNMYAVGGGPGDELDPEQLKAQGYVEYDNYFYNPTTGQYVDKPSENKFIDEYYEKNLENYLGDPSMKFSSETVKPIEGRIGYPQLPLKASYIDEEGYPRFYGDPANNPMVDLQLYDNYMTRYKPIQPQLEQQYPILDREGNVQTTPKDFNKIGLGSIADSSSFSEIYEPIRITRDKVRRAYQNKSPYLDNMVDESAKPNKSNTYLNNLNTPNYVDNQGNTSSILSRRNKNQSTPVQPIERMQSRNLQQLPADNTVPGLVGSEGDFKNFSNQPVIEEDLQQLYAPPYAKSNTSGFIPSDVMTNRMETPTVEGPLNTSIPRETSTRQNITEQNIKFVPPGGSDMIEDLPGFTPNQTKVSDEAIGQSYLGTAANPNLPKLTFTQSDATKYGLNPNDVNIIKDPKVNQPNQGLGILDYGSMIGQAAGPLSQLYYGLKGPDDVNYERITGQKIDPTVAIALAAEEGRRAQDSAAYLMRQSAPTSGSYMNNLRNLSLQSGKQRGALAGGLRYQADLTNTQMQNQINAQNAQIAMQEQIDRQQERDAARTNVTEGLSGVGSSTANMIKDYKTNQINQMIAKNIGTNDWRFDTVTNEIVFRRDGKEVRLPAETVTGTNAVNIGTGQMQQSQNLPFDPNFKFKRTNKYLQNPNG